MQGKQGAGINVETKLTQRIYIYILLTVEQLLMRSMRTTVCLAAAVAVVLLAVIDAREIQFFGGSDCGGSVLETVDSDCCSQVQLSWAGEDILSIESSDLESGDTWYFSANTDENCRHVFGNAELLKACVSIDPPFKFHSGNEATSMLYDGE